MFMTGAKKGMVKGYVKSAAVAKTKAQIFTTSKAAIAKKHSQAKGPMQKGSSKSIMK